MGTFTKISMCFIKLFSCKNRYNRFRWLAHCLLNCCRKKKPFAIISFHRETSMRVPIHCDSLCVVSFTKQAIDGTCSTFRIPTVLSFFLTVHNRWISLASAPFRLHHASGFCLSPFPAYLFYMNRYASISFPSAHNFFPSFILTFLPLPPPPSPHRYPLTLYYFSKCRTFF